MHRPKPRLRFVAWSVGGVWALVTIASARGQAHAQADPQATPSNQAASVTSTAQPLQSSPSNSNVYDGFIEQALQAYDGGRFAEARSSFRRAHEVLPTARTLRTIGMCSFNLGDYADAATNLEASLQDSRKPLTSEQRKQASDLIARCSQQIGRFQLRLSPPDATLSVDGRVATHAGQRELLLDPGRHELTVQAHGYRSVDSVLNVDGGDHTTLEYHLPPDIMASLSDLQAPEASQPSAADTRRDYASTSPGTERSKAQSTLGYVSLGIGAAGLVGFGVTSVLALVEQHKLNDRCPDTNCSPGRFHELDRYNALKVASTATLIGGAAFVLLGSGLLLFQPEHLPHEQTAQTKPTSIEPLIGLGSLGVRGQL